MNLLSHWQFWAILSAVFAAATALLSKAGLRGVDPDAAQLVRTVVVVIALGIALSALGKVKAVSELTTKNWTYLVLAVPLLSLLASPAKGCGTTVARVPISDVT